MALRDSEERDKPRLWVACRHLARMGNEKRQYAALVPAACTSAFISAKFPHDSYTKYQTLLVRC